MAVLFKWLQKLAKIVHSRGTAKMTARKPKRTRKSKNTEAVQLVEFNKFNNTHIVYDEKSENNVEDHKSLAKDNLSENFNSMFWPVVCSGMNALQLNEIEKIEELDVKIDTIRAMRKQKRNSVQITSIFDMAGGYFHMSITSNLNMNSADYFASSQISTFVERITFDQNADCARFEPIQYGSNSLVSQSDYSKTPSFPASMEEINCADMFSSSQISTFIERITFEHNDENKVETGTISTFDRESAKSSITTKSGFHSSL